MQPTKWDLVLDQRPVPLIDHLVEEVARLFANDLAAWPPRVEDFDPQTGRHLAALLADAPRSPDRRVYEEAFTLAQLDLAREVEAYDDYMRNHRWLATGLTPADKPMVLFLARFLTEQLLGLAEATQGRLDRPRLLDVLSRTRRHFFSKGLSS